MYINQIIEKSKELGIVPIKATDREIDEIMQLSPKGYLPKAYIEFMKEFGNGGYMRGDSCFMDEIGMLQTGAVELLEENESSNNLTDNDFVFWMSQGYMFCFFRLDEGDNPPVYYYNEAKEDKFIKITNSLSDFLLGMMIKDKRLFNEI